MYQFENFKNKPLMERVVDNILSYIADNDIKIGTKLPNEFELAEMFGVGRSTIREAIKVLASKQVLEVRRGAGTYVIGNKAIDDSNPLGLNLSEDRYKLALDLFDVRLMLEPEIAVLAARMATAKEMEELMSYCESVEYMIRNGIDHTEEDIKFHTCIARCSKNQVVEHLIPIINSSVAVFANITHLQLKEETIRTHRAIADAIIQRDVIGARCAMMMHLTYNRELILKIIADIKIRKNKKNEES